MPQTDDERRANREKWKADPQAYFEYLRDTMYDHQQIADELARDPGLEPKDRLRALADYVKIAKDVVASLHLDREEDDATPERVAPVETGPKRGPGKKARRAAGPAKGAPGKVGE